MPRLLSRRLVSDRRTPRPPVILVALLLCAASRAAAGETPLGPGVAGEFHAFAFDGSTGRMYAGGDNCGVYIKDPADQTWRLFNDGLDNPDFTDSFSVEDFLVIDDPDLPANTRGVYAATRGGLYLLREGATSWVLVTDYSDSTYLYSGAPYFPGTLPIPFSTLAYDPHYRMLYAGTGHGRWVANNDGLREEVDIERIYPQVPAEGGGYEPGQYSIWQADLALPAGVPVLEPVVHSEGKGIVTQIATVHYWSAPLQGNFTHVVFAARQGIFGFLHGAAKSATVDVSDEWAAAGADLEAEGWTGSTIWGVGAGSESYIYALAENYPIGTEGRPGMYCRDFSDPAAAWEFLGDSAQPIPPRDVVWYDPNDFGPLNLSYRDPAWGEDEGVGVLTVTVVPHGTDHALDEVFIGMRRHEGAGHHGGYYRYCGDGTGWTQPIGFRDESPNTYFSYDWRTDTESPIDMGWRLEANLHALTPLEIDPAGDAENRRMLATLGPVTGMSSDYGRHFGQNYCEGSPGSWKSLGLNVMNAYTGTITESGEIIIGGADVGLFRATSPSNDRFRWISEYKYSGNRRTLDVETCRHDGQTEVYALRTYLLGMSCGDGSFSIAKLESDEGPWSCVFDEPAVRVNDIEFLGDDNLLCVTWGDSLSAYPYGHVWHAERDVDGTFSTWAPIPHFAPSGGGPPTTGEFYRLRHVPGTTRFLLGTRAAPDYYGITRGGVVSFDLNDPNSVTTWDEATQSGTTTAEVATSWVESIAVDRTGSFAYVATGAYPNRHTTSPGVGTVLRFEIPDDPSIVPAMEVLANTDMSDNTFGIPAPFVNPYSGSLPVHGVYTRVNDIAIDPNNPMIVYAGVGSMGLHSSNGVWKFDASQIPGGEWSHVAGDGLMYTQVVMIDPEAEHDQSRLYFGTVGQEFFETSIAVSPAPNITTRSPFAVERRADLGATLLTVEVVSTSGLALDTVYADISVLQAGTETLLPLFDNGASGDQIAGDAIWTAEIDSVAAPEGEYAIEVLARDEDWNTAVESVVVPVFTVAATFRDGSAETGDLETGVTSQPLAVMPTNADGDDFIDLVVTELAGSGSYFGAERGLGDVPVFQYRTDEMFADPSERPTPQTSNIVAADYDNDGHEDFFACYGPEPRLYRWNPHPDVENYEIVTNDVMSIVPDRVYAAAWGDYNRDGWIDLAVAGEFFAPFPGGDPALGEDNVHIYRNVLGKLEFAHFVPVSLSTAKAYASWPYSIIWADLDPGDQGELELIVSDASVDVDGLLVYRRTASFDPLIMDYEFIDVTASCFPGGVPEHVAQPALLDYDADGDQDLVVAGNGTGNNLRFFRNDGGAFVPDDTSAWSVGMVAEQLNGVLVSDLDTDGAPDLVTLPAAEVAPRRLVNRVGQGMGFVEPAISGLPVGQAGGGLAFDWLGGKPNVYLAKSPPTPGGAVEEFFYSYAHPAGATSRYVRIKVGPGDVVNGSGIGTRFDLEWDGQHHYQWVDGGTGRAGQSPRDIVFHVGDYAGASVNLHARWPDGTTSSQTLFPDLWGTLFELSESLAIPKPSTATIDSSSVTSEFIMGPEENWFVFEWDADHLGRPEVWVINNDPNNPNECLCMMDYALDAILTMGDPNVEAEITQTGEFSYHYKLTWHDRCCYAGCLYRFQVQTTLNGAAATSGYFDHRTPRFCISGQP